MTALNQGSLPELSVADVTAWLRDRTAECLCRSAAALAAIPDADAPAALRLWDESDDAVDAAEGIAELLADVHPDESVRRVAHECVREVERHRGSRVRDRRTFAALTAIEGRVSGPDASQLLSLVLADFRRNGIELPPADRQRLDELDDRIVELIERFRSNIRADTRHMAVSAARCGGLPPDFVASHTDADGLVRLSTNPSDHRVVVRHCDDAEVRRDLTRELYSRAYPENDQVLAQLRAARHEKALLLGQASWPHHVAEQAMLSSPDQVAELLVELDELIRPMVSDVRECLLDAGLHTGWAGQPLDPSSLPWLTERLVRATNSNCGTGSLGDYLRTASVVPNVLTVIGGLFGLRFVRASAPTWHEDVDAYEVSEADRPAGRLYLDLHPRAGKTTGAGHFGLRTGCTARGVLPESALVANLPRDRLEQAHLVTLIHEFGHAVHNLLAVRGWSRLSGVSTERDFVEAPSQMLEQWAWNPAVLARIACDKDGNPPPSALVKAAGREQELLSVVAARTQLMLAVMSLQLYLYPSADADSCVRAIEEAYDPLDRIPGTHLYTSFGHLGDYSSMYYTYLWNRVLARDLLTGFDEDDLLNVTAARRYADIVLRAGSSRPAAQLVHEFLGRPPDLRAYAEWLERSRGRLRPAHVEQGT